MNLVFQLCPTTLIFAFESLGLHTRKTRGREAGSPMKRKLTQVDMDRDHFINRRCNTVRLSNETT